LYRDYHRYIYVSQNWGESHILEEMHQKGRFGSRSGAKKKNEGTIISHFAIIEQASHHGFSDMCMITPLWLGRGTGVTGTRNPIETAKDIEVLTWNFVSSVLKKKNELNEKSKIIIMII